MVICSTDPSSVTEIPALPDKPCIERLGPAPTPTKETPPKLDNVVPDGPVGPASPPTTSVIVNAEPPASVVIVSEPDILSTLILNLSPTLQFIMQFPVPVFAPFELCLLYIYTLEPVTSENPDPVSISKYALVIDLFDPDEISVDTR